LATVLLLRTCFLDTLFIYTISELIKSTTVGKITAEDLKPEGCQLKFIKAREEKEKKLHYFFLSYVI